MTGYDVSRDDRVVAAVVERDGKTGVWVAWLDGREPPRRIPHADGDSPKFGRDGEILFRAPEKDSGVLYRIRENGERRERIAQVNGAVFGTVSPDGEWLSAIAMDNITNDDAFNEWKAFISALSLLTVEPVALEPGRQTRVLVDTVRGGFCI